MPVGKRDVHEKRSKQVTAFIGFVFLACEAARMWFEGTIRMPRPQQTTPCKKFHRMEYGIPWYLVYSLVFAIVGTRAAAYSVSARQVVPYFGVVLIGVTRQSPVLVFVLLGPWRRTADASGNSTKGFLLFWCRQNQKLPNNISLVNIPPIHDVFSLPMCSMSFNVDHS